MARNAGKLESSATCYLKSRIQVAYYRMVISKSGINALNVLKVIFVPERFTGIKQMSALTMASLTSKSKTQAE